jgi:hypothetical protein
VFRQKKGIEKLKMDSVKQNPMYPFLIVLTISCTIGLQIRQTLINNFAVESAHLDGSHIAAVALPFIDGLLWMVDYRIPFLIGAGLSLISLIIVQKMRVR